MAKFMVKSFLICVVMFLGVIFGMQQANEGLKSMRGYETPETLGAFHIQEKDEGQLEASILGNTVTSHDLEKKQEQLEKMKAFNFFSELGKWLSDAISSLVNAVIDFVSIQLEKLFEHI
ncbi:YqxA family protein [Bacillus sp. FJAT-47783]|uniref:YqxA family protein n=1 Tax=Bacillus sp. FJAT-47783 TaxID=2922712 RepID=UPI001FADD853|nr:YqxA family protein [Bacillus sp. FJAT-47783]